MRKGYFTFGQMHNHDYRGMHFDKDTVVEIHADNPADVMHRCFGLIWAMEYHALPDMQRFRKGVIMLDNYGRILGTYSLQDDDHTKKQSRI